MLREYYSSVFYTNSWIQMQTLYMHLWTISKDHREGGRREAGWSKCDSGR